MIRIKQAGPNNGAGYYFLYTIEMKQITAILIALAVAFGAMASRHEFTTFENDPLDTRMYTLPNGLKVFMSVN